MYGIQGSVVSKNVPARTLTTEIWLRPQEQVRSSSEIKEQGVSAPRQPLLSRSQGSAGRCLVKGRDELAGGWPEEEPFRSVASQPLSMQTCPVLDLAQRWRRMTGAG